MKVLAAAYFALLGYLLRATGTDRKLFDLAVQLYESHVEYVAEIHANANGRMRENMLLAEAMVNSQVKNDPG